MSRITVAVASFVAGISSTLLFLALSGSHTSILAQEPPLGRAFSFGDKVPIVPPIGPLMKGSEMHGNLEQPLDGINCEDCVFDGTMLTYAGGAVRLVNPKFSGSIRVKFSGAAANGLTMAAFLQAMLQNQKPPTYSPNAPIIRRATAKDVFIANLVTPYGQK